VQDLLRLMTTEEKARQLDMYQGSPDLIDKAGDDKHATPDAVLRPDEAQKLLGNLGVGSIHDLYGSPLLTNQIQTWVLTHSRLGIPALFIEEGLHGFSHGTVFPAPINLASTWNVDLAKQTGAAIAAEARATGVDMLLAPVLDLAREPRWGRVEEDFGEDPYLTGQMGLAYVHGFQGASLSRPDTVIAEPKHFAAHGSPESGTNTSPVHLGERELRSVMLKSFEPSVREGRAMGIMAAYHEIDGIPAAADPFLLKKILRQEWGFQGFVLSDLGAIRRLYDTHHVAATEQDAVVKAINAGVDMQFYDFSHEVFQQAIIDGIKDGSLSPEALDRAVSDVLRVKFSLGLFDKPLVDPTLEAKTQRTSAHLALSLESAEESMTLLKNDDHLLPLSKSLKRIAVIGPNTTTALYGDYADELHGARVSMLAGIREIAPQADIASSDGKDIADAVDKAKSADVVILGLGERQGISGEGFDRSNLDLPENQEALLEAVVATGKPTVLVLQNGRPLVLGWAKQHVPAILEAWYPGEFGGDAIAAVLFGDVNPSGHLTVSFPGSVGALPDFYNHDPSKGVKYVDGDGRPLFSFGFGLSYTSFRFADLKVQVAGSSDVVVTVNVTNIGQLAGDEVAQLYVRQMVSSVETPERALKGFSRVHLGAGETKAVTFRVPQSELALWNAEGRWSVESGTYKVWVGDSSDAELSTTFQLISAAK